jgi:beta-glucosidase
MSDWGATHSTVQSANSGLDMQMPDATYFGDALAKAIVNRQVPTPRFLYSMSAP